MKRISLNEDSMES